MKRAAAILLSLLFLLEWGGYRLVVSGLREQEKNRLQVRLDDRQYDPTALISVKVAASHLSTYTQQSSEFIRVNGEITIDGVQYSYVKKRFYNDSLEFICIADPTATHLVALQTELGSRFGNSQYDCSKKTNSLSATARDFSIGSYIFSNTLPLSDRQASIASTVSVVNAAASDGFLNTAEPPPDGIHS